MRRRESVIGGSLYDDSLSDGGCGDERQWSCGWGYAFNAFEIAGLKDGCTMGKKAAAMNQVNAPSALLTFYRFLPPVRFVTDDASEVR